MVLYWQTKHMIAQNYKMMNKMKALICLKPGHFNSIKKQRPVLKKGQAIIKIKRIGICGTDIHAFEGNQPFLTYPRILGHEVSGILVQADGANGFIGGESVTIIPYFNCGTCIACRNGKPNCCIQVKVCGVHMDGGMVEYLSIPSASLVHGEGLTFDELALVEPLAIAAHAVQRANIDRDEFVLVIGAGPIGLGAIEFSRISGGQVIALDIDENRLKFCKEKLNVAHTINAFTDNITEKLLEITNGDMPTVVFDATGNLKAITKGFDYIAHGGKYILIGIQKEEISFSHPEFHKREITLMSSRNATRQDFEYVIKCLKKKKIKPTNYITHRLLFDEVANEFKNWLLPENRVIKAMIELPYSIPLNLV